MLRSLVATFHTLFLLVGFLFPSITLHAEAFTAIETRLSRYVVENLWKMSVYHLHIAYEM